MHNRENALNKWLQAVLGTSDYSLHPLTGDASFRRYYRLHFEGDTQIVMDAPPGKEPLLPFINIATVLSTYGIRTPKIHKYNELEGFALLEDFGDSLFLDKICADRVERLYQSAITPLVTLQQCSLSYPYVFPHFDKDFMLSELNLFIQWFLDRYLGMSLSDKEQNLIEQTFDWLSEEIAKQPRVLIHRDYHSRNIMVPAESSDTRLAIIDFQDAMEGPFTYDLVSLLKDCYIQWPKDIVMRQITYFYEQSTLAKQWSLPAFIRAFDLCGLQRHLKVLGVFSRLSIRDNKPNYLKDLPLTLHYVLDTLETYDELQPFYQFMQQRIQLP